MITQTFKQGNNEIKIETAENIEDIEKNDFKNGIYNKIYINGKIIPGYMAMISHIIEESKKNKNKVISDKKNLESLRMEMIDKNKKETLKNIEKLHTYYKEINAPQSVLDEIERMKNTITKNSIENKINGSGLRIDQ